MTPSVLLQKNVAIDQLRIKQRAEGNSDLHTSGCYDWILPILPVYVLYTDDSILKGSCKTKTQLII